MSGHDKNPKRLEEITAKCPSCLEINAMEYLGEMKHNGKSIANYRCHNCRSCRTIPTILKLNPELIYNEE